MAFTIMSICSSCEMQDDSIYEYENKIISQRQTYDIYDEIVEDFKIDESLSELDNFEKFITKTNDLLISHDIKEYNYSTLNDYINIRYQNEDLLNELNFSEQLNHSIIELFAKNEIIDDELDFEEKQILNQINGMKEKDYKSGKTGRRRAIIFAYGLQYNITTAYTYAGYYELSDN